MDFREIFDKVVEAKGSAFIDDSDNDYGLMAAKFIDAAEGVISAEEIEELDKLEEEHKVKELLAETLSDINDENYDYFTDYLDEAVYAEIKRVIEYAEEPLYGEYLNSAIREVLENLINEFQ